MFWCVQPLQAYRLPDLNLIKSYLKEIGSLLYDEVDVVPFDKLCINMGTSNSMPEFMKPKNVGLMFFSMNPDKYMPYAQIDVVEFPEGAGGNQIIEKIFKGPLHYQLREALQYIQNSVIKEKIIKYPDRAEADRFYNYPYAAIEEALANAVYHKAYDVREPIEVRIEPDYMEIISHPGPDRSVTIEGLKEFKVSNRRYRNRRIREFLKELHLTEGRNTGFKKILNALEHNGSPQPEFETDEEHSYFITRIYIHDDFKASENEALNEALSENEKLIISMIKQNSDIKQKEIIENTTISRAQVQRIMKSLQERGVIAHENSKKIGKWIVK